jgi:IclR family transcriptional regulator, acetate operon repressor
MEKESNNIQSVRKAMLLLDRVVLHDINATGVTFADIVSEFGWPAGTVHNLLKTLVQTGYLRMNGRGIYTVGSKCHSIARVFQCNTKDFTTGINAILQKFVNEYSEACNAIILNKGERVVVGYVDSTQVIRALHATVDNSPFFSKPTGRLLTALADDNELWTIIDHQGMPGEDWDNITDINTLKNELEKIKKAGYCIINDTATGLVAISCPVYTCNGKLWGVLGTFAPEFRCDNTRTDILLSALQKMAEEITAFISA